MALDTSWATALTKSIESQRGAVLMRAAGGRVPTAPSNGHTTPASLLAKSLARGAQRRKRFTRAG